jgi:uncharacterized protein
MSVGLLDVNVLIALAWPSHVHHRQAHAWFTANHSSGWATCPLTQCGFVRVSSNPKIIAEAVTPQEALALLREMLSLKHHVFWPDNLPLQRGAVPTELLVSHRQIIDAYLLGLCIKNKGKLITFDRGLAALVSSKSGHRGALEILPAGE